MNSEIYHKRRIEDELKGAIGTGAFFLSYQPKLSLDSGRLVGVEALVRWRMDDKTIRMPNEFIGVAEETGTIVPLGYQILQEAIEGFLWLREKGLESRVAVNISARQIKEHDCVANIKALFDANPDVISYFDLEITESAFIGSEEGNINRLKALRELGFSIAIDDFGKGYSSLSYLQKLPADTLKIDRSFVAELPHDHASVEISKTILALAKHMNLQVVAEGVETEAQASFLRENACDIAQGFLYGRPMSLSELVLAYADQRVG